jgi:hypothetical protein
MIVISIAQEDIEWKPVQTKSGLKHYASLVVDKRKEKDQYENTHTVSLSQSKEQRAEKAKKQYVGNGKEYNFVENKQEYKAVNQQEKESHVTDLDDLF